MTVKDKAVAAKTASRKMSSLSRRIKDDALFAVSHALLKNAERIFTANKSDIEKAERDKLAAPLLKRLAFTQQKMDDVIAGIASTIDLEDPSNRILGKTLLDEGLELWRTSCPIGVIGMIFESRPDALVQIATLCLKSGNSVLLKGGSEAAETNRVLAEIIRDSSVAAGIPEGWIQHLETRTDVSEMLSLDSHIDLLIPRGSNEFVRYIMDNTKIPVLGHADGICHVYVDSPADIEMAVSVVNDSKTQYVAVCNAAETLLVHEDTAQAFLPRLKDALPAVKLLGCERTQNIIDVEEAHEKDWATEYLDYILSIRIVDSIEEAIDHINCYGSGHTDAIVSEDKDHAEQFMALVDSADVFWNCSTRFADGFKFGLGAEIGISTAKIHSRGPVGLDGLVIYKWKLYGGGHTVANYTGPDARKFIFKKLG